MTGPSDDWKLDSVSLKVAVMPTIDCLPIYLADELGLFALEKAEVCLVPYQAQMDCDTAFASGWVDGMATDLVRAERLQQQGLSLNYATSSELHWQLITAKQSRITQMSQMDDKMVAMTRFSATAMLADLLVDSVKLQPERVFKIQVNDVAVRLSMLETGVMDAMFLPEPQATVARCLDSKVIFDTQAVDWRMGVIAFKKLAETDTLRSRQLAGFMKAYATACDSLNERGVAAYRHVLSRRCGVKEWVADSLAPDYHFAKPQPPRQQDVDRAKAWLKKN
jgi:NitT/TauT family transport system substrate-binding protein